MINTPPVSGGPGQAPSAGMLSPAGSPSDFPFRQQGGAQGMLMYPSKITPDEGTADHDPNREVPERQ